VDQVIAFEYCDIICAQLELHLEPLSAFVMGALFLHIKLIRLAVEKEGILLNEISHSQVQNRLLSCELCNLVVSPEPKCLASIANETIFKEYRFFAEQIIFD
jgi:hypothetical protein